MQKTVQFLIMVSLFNTYYMGDEVKREEKINWFSGVSRLRNPY